MKQFFKLYRSEVRNNLMLAIFLYFAYYGIYIFSLVISHSEVNPWKTYHFSMFFPSLCSLPVILFYSFTVESRTKRNHFLFSLPIKRSTVIFSTFMALLSMVFIIPAGTFFFRLPFLPSRMWIFMKPIFNISLEHQIDYNQALNLISKVILVFSAVVMVSGILCAAKSLQTALKKYKSVVVFIFLMTAQFFSLMIITFLRFYYGPVPVRHQIHTDEALQLYFQAMIDYSILSKLVNSGYMVVMGLLFLFIGVTLYEKFSDV